MSRSLVWFFVRAACACCGSVTTALTEAAIATLRTMTGAERLARHVCSTSCTYTPKERRLGVNAMEKQKVAQLMHKAKPKARHWPFESCQSLPADFGPGLGIHFVVTSSSFSSFFPCLIIHWADMQLLRRHHLQRSRSKGNETCITSAASISWAPHGFIAVQGSEHISPTCHDGA